MTEAVDQMAPDASPGEMSKKLGVRRVNNMPMYILGGVILLFLIVMALVAADRAAKQNAPADGPKEKASSASMFAKEIAGDYNDNDGLIKPASMPKVPDMPTDSVPLEIARPENPDAPPPPPNLGTNLGTPQPVNDEEAQRIRMAKLQMFSEAVKAKTSVRVDAPRSRGSAPGGAAYAGPPQTREEMLNRIAELRQQVEAQRSTDPTAAYQARLAQIRSMGLGDSAAGVGGFGGGGGAPQLMQISNSAGSRNSLAQFSQGSEGDRWKLDSKPEPPRSPYELRAGFVIPATLISGINSELPGQIMAQVSQDVYDTPTGKYLLIPQGSRLVGAYSSDVAYGQARVLVAWQRIVFPDGKAMDIGAMPGADGAGYAGFNDKVNNHYFRLFASAFLMSGVTAGITLSQDNSNDRNGDRQRASDAMSEAVGQQLGQATAQLIAKNLNIAPTLEIRPGYRFNVIVTKDMTFSKPYRAFDY